jgi:hypothetical protein
MASCASCRARTATTTLCSALRKALGSLLEQADRTNLIALDLIIA